MAAILAYTYRADIFCPECAVHEYAKDNDTLVLLPAETFFDQQANIAGVDRQNEHTFDSDEFPKVVFSWQIEPRITGEGDTVPEVCGTCGVEL